MYNDLVEFFPHLLKVSKETVLTKSDITNAAFQDGVLLGLGSEDTFKSPRSLLRIITLSFLRGMIQAHLQSSNAHVIKVGSNSEGLVLGEYHLGTPSPIDTLKSLQELASEFGFQGGDDISLVQFFRKRLRKQRNQKGIPL